MPATGILGVLGDTSTAPGATRLSPVSSVLTSTAGYAGSGNRSTNPQLANQYCNGSRVVPELPGVINPPSVKNLQAAATVDEGNNYVNLRYGPLYVENPVNSTTFGDYHIAGTASSAYNAGTGDRAVPNHDFDAQARPLAGLYDIGADEFGVGAGTGAQGSSPSRRPRSARSPRCWELGSWPLATRPAR